MFSSQKRKIYLQMLKAVAEAIGPDYLDQVVFVGGCTTVLFMDENDAERIRHTPVCQPKHEPTDFEITYKSGCLGERNAKANHSS